LFSECKLFQSEHRSSILLKVGHRSAVWRGVSLKIS
jgi:hypothetical protein